jgi:hypothetical protein
MKVAVIATMFVLAAGGAALAGPPPHPSHPSHPASQGAAHSTHAVTPSTGPKGTATVVPRNPKLVTRLQGLLGSLPVDQAANGFTNQGQFIAAVHVSHNLDIPFGDLKSKLVTDGATLGSAIHTLKPTADADTEAARGNKQATDDLNEQ